MEELTPLQESNISHIVKKFYNNEQLVNYDLDFSKWTIKKLYSNTLWVQLIDEPDTDTVIRGGLVLPAKQVKGLYRIGRVIMAGDDVKHAKVGEYIRFPQGVGSPYETKFEGYKTWLLSENHVMMVVNPPSEDVEEVRQHIEDTLLSPV